MPDPQEPRSAGGNERDSQLIQLALRQVERAASHGGSLSQTRSRWRAVEKDLATRFGGYDLVRELHRGGQGTVYLAVQRGTQRQVAVKSLHGGPFISRSELARFEREIQVLAALRHPSIVTIHESGSRDGAFYYVMDYIEGQPLDEYLAPRRAAANGAAHGKARDPAALRGFIRETLELFAQICDAVQVAHQRGVLHRDLKPGNVLVDAAGAPHVLDFGLAKVESINAPASTVTVTQTGQFVGTLAYASPEQLEANPNEIDIRTDIYSLGVLLYHALTGRYPYDVAGSLRDVTERILHTPPPRPGSVERAIDAEVETIVLKCLQKERERRYASAGDLARDIRDYLGGRPIEARRDSTVYVIRKQLWRHRVPVIIAGGFVALLLVSLGVTLHLLNQTKQQRDRALAAENQQFQQREQTAQQRDRALAAEHEQFRLREQAERSAAEARAITRFLQEMLESTSSREFAGREVTVRELLDRTSARMEREPPGQAAIESALHSSLGRGYLALGLPEQAAPHVYRALELRGALHQTPALMLADAHKDTAMVELRRANLDVAERHALAALAEHAAAGSILSSEYASAQNTLALVLRAQGRFQEALAAQREALAGYLVTLGPDHLTTASCHGNLAITLTDLGRHVEAEAQQRVALASKRQHLPDGHPEIAHLLVGLGASLRHQRRYAEALESAAQGIDALRCGETLHDPMFASALGQYGAILHESQRYDEAEAAYNEVQEINRQRLGPDHPELATGYFNLGALAEQRQQYPKAEALLRKAVAIRQARLSPDHPGVANVLYRLAAVLQRQCRSEEAVAAARESLRIRRQRFGPTHAQTIQSLSLLGELLIAQEEFETSERLLLSAAQHYQGLARKRDPAFQAAYQMNCERLILLYDRWGRDREATSWRVELDAQRGTASPTTSGQDANSGSTLPKPSRSNG